MLIQRALQYAGKQGSAVDAGKALLVFKDQASIASWAKQAVAEILAAGITNGQSEGRFEASSQATRAEATVMIKRMLQTAKFIN
ncbi:Endo-1,4-beta-xylanase A precursor [compost metagenome]